MRYGKFSSDGKSFIITNPNTPRPWFNYLFNARYHALVSQTGGGFSYYLDPKTNRTLRYEHIHTDRPGRYLLIRDEKGRLINCNWQPTRERLDAFKCTHTPGKTTIQSKKCSIETEITYFVPRREPLEVWLIKIKNNSKKTKKLRIFSFCELVSGNIEMESVYRNITCLYNQAYFDKKNKCIMAFKHPSKDKQIPLYSYFSQTGSVSGFETSKEKFYGRYNDVQYPEMVRKGKLNGTEVRGEDMVAALSKDIVLAPGAETEFACLLGSTYKKKDISRYLKKYRKLKNCKKELKELECFWKEKLSSIWVETPDKDFDLMTNIWGKYQLFAITSWRGTSQYHGGEGGLGYRDTAQDIEGLLSLDRDLAFSKLEKILFWQYKSGHAVSGFSETEGSWDKEPNSFVSGKSDVAVWLIYTVVSYLKETGNFKFLNKKYSFHDGGVATVYEHIKRAARYIYSKRGKHGLPLIGKADWNDAYDAVGVGGKGESVWLGMALCRALKELHELAKYIGDVKTATEMQTKYNHLKRIINKVGWDGNWYLAAYNDGGRKIGSSQNKEGRVPLNSQTWAILSGVVPHDRLKTILKKITNFLETPYGPALFLPSYTKFDPGIGRVTSFAPGTKENAAIFSHACAFKIVADCKIKRAKEAFETFKKLLPFSKAKSDHDKYKAEPYVWAEYVIGPGNKENFGEGTFTWNTGTTPWMFLAACEWILGVRRDFDGLLIDPCIPRNWKRCSIKRPFRGATYLIQIENPKGVSFGVKEIYCDGKLLKGNLIKPHCDGKLHRVRVVLDR
jgi:cellobiose phosphorylase